MAGLILAAACRRDRFLLPRQHLAIPVRHAARRPPEAKLAPELRRSLPPSGGARARPVLVDLAVQVDLPELARLLARRGAGRLARRELVIAALAAVARQSQGDLRPFLERLRRAGRIGRYRGFSVVNRLLVEATPAGIREIARRPEVAAIAGETAPAETALAFDDAAPGAAGAERTSWAIAATGADRAWRRGLDGRGVVVGAIDSGASAQHEQLRGNFRGGPRSWLDPAGGSAAPRDTRFGHGTGVLSCAVGQNRAGMTLGMAPAARWVACAGLPEGRYDNVLLTECADWMLSTARPDVLIGAWLLPADGCDRSLAGIVDAWRAAEILPVFAAGNRGPAPATDRSPANYDRLFPGRASALSVGGTTRAGALFAQTSRGPSRCGGTVFPRLVAPAEDLVTAFPLAPSTYVRAQGTSFAAGLAAGAAAILLSSRPDSSVTELEEALGGRAGASGASRLDVPAALARLAGRRSRVAHATDR